MKTPQGVSSEVHSFQLQSGEGTQFEKPCGCVAYLRSPPPAAGQPALRGRPRASSARTPGARRSTRAACTPGRPCSTASTQNDVRAGCCNSWQTQTALFLATSRSQTFPHSTASPGTCPKQATDSHKNGLVGEGFKTALDNGQTVPGSCQVHRTRSWRWLACVR